MKRNDLFAVPGLRGAAVKTNVKASGDLDLALIVADEPMVAAGVFTTSAVAAPPVRVCREALAEQPRAKSIVINSGNANALTGTRGAADAKRMVDATAAAVGGPALVLSTGIIGVPMPINNVIEGIESASTALGNGDGVARAILTTDTCEKTAALDGPGFVTAGIAKGSGMIHPNMATMLAIIATDAPVPADALRTILKRAVDRSFHEISVDGDTSTNDAVLLLAREPSKERAITNMDAVEWAVTEVARSLARQIIEDGEGATRVLEIEVCEARREEEARRVAKAIACSSLVKTALAGGDPNWGRILSAAGNSGVALQPSDLTLSIGDCVVFRRGTPTNFCEAALTDYFSGPRVRVRLDLASGDRAGRMLTTDLSHRYVEINSEYRT